MSEDPIKTIGRYLIEREIGRGGMAVVYKAHDPHLDRPVAIKLIRKGAFTGDQLATLPERFRREARALAKLDHANIVKVLDYGDHDGATYLVMEYLEGATLKEVKKPLRVEAAVRLIRPIAEALEYVHAHGILHRDVKPSNIMITRNDRIMLTDFGIAKWLEDEADQYTLTAAGIGIGTPEYMAPEQGLGKKIDERADAYALSVVFYELITGRKPFQGETALEILTKQASEPFPDPRTFVPELNESVRKFFDRALAKKPDDRYPTMKDYLRDLDGLRLQSLAQASSGNTGIQTVRSGASTTESSIRLGKTDVQKVRDAAAAAADEPAAAPAKSHPTAKEGSRRRLWWAPLLAGVAALVGFFALRSLTGNQVIAPAVTDPAGVPIVIRETDRSTATGTAVWATATVEPTAAIDDAQQQTAEAIQQTFAAKEATEQAAAQTISAENQMATEETLQRNLTEAAAAELTSTAEFSNLSTAIAQTVSAESRMTAEKMMNQTATAEQILVSKYETLAVLNQRLTETKAATYLKTATPAVAMAKQSDDLPEVCEPWAMGQKPGSLFSFYGNRINTSSNPNRIFGAMAVVKPPESAIGKDWEIIVADYSEKLASNPHASNRYSCSMISGNLHCGPFDYAYVANRSHANLSFDSFDSFVHFYPKGMDCRVYTAEIPYHLVDQVRNALGGSSGGASGEAPAGEEEPSSPPSSPGNDSNFGAYDLT